MSFAVIVPAYNGSRTIVTAVESAVNQVDVDEVVVVDDGSTDDTATVVEGLADPSVRVIRQPNRGPAAARNAGSRAATATYLLFLDADDVLLPTATEQFSAAAGGAELVRSGALYRDRTGEERMLLAAPGQWAFPRGVPLAGTFCIDRALFQRIGGYDEEMHYGENSELLYRAQRALLRSKDPIAFTGVPTVHVRANPLNTAAKYRTRRLHAIERLLELHGEDLREDRVTLHDHLAIAAKLSGEEGDSAAAVRHGWAAATLRPWSPRAWARLARSAVPARRSRLDREAQAH